MTRGFRNTLLLTEFTGLYIGIPLLLFLDVKIGHPSILLLPVLTFILLILHYRTDFRWSELFSLKIARKDFRRDALVLAASALVLLLAVLLFFPDRLFNLPRANPIIWLALGSFYPVFSAYPQEVLYRTYIFRRYPKVFARDWMKIAASGISFSFVHILYYHPVSIVLTLIGGIYMAMAYRRTGSVLYTAILHSIFGMFVFSFGLGEFFWLDMYDYI